MRAELATVAGSVADAARRRGSGTTSTLADLAEILVHDHPRPRPGSDGLVEHRWRDLPSVFGLSDDECLLLAIAAAAELDTNFATAFALLQGQTQAGGPSVALAFELAGLDSRSPALRLVHPRATLRRHGLLRLGDDGGLLLRRLGVPERLTAHLLGSAERDPATVRATIDTVPVTFAASERLVAHLSAGTPVAYVQSAPGTAGLAMAAGAFAALDLPYRAVGIDETVTAAQLGAVLLDVSLDREGLVVRLGGRASTDHGADRRLFEALADAVVPVLVVGTGPWHPDWLDWIPPVVTAEPLSDRGRAALWHGLVPELHLGPESTLPPFTLTPEQIQAVGNAARADAAAAGVPLDAEHVSRAARVTAGTLGDLPGVRRSQPQARFADLTLAEPTAALLTEIVGWTRHRSQLREQHAFLQVSGMHRGVAALFAGPSGTGKTLAVTALAAELGFELLTVDLSAVVDKYIGETEKNLEKVFAAAEMLNCVLFFDEADALFGSRSAVNDARDKYANQETAWLLQRMESFSGLAILATNLRANLDRAFTRRLNFVVVFDAPTPPLRLELWHRFLADVGHTDPDDPLDLALLAEHAELSGGEIKNVVMAALHRTLIDDKPLGMGILLRATAREYDKLGRRMPPQLTMPSGVVAPSGAGTTGVRR